MKAETIREACARYKLFERAQDANGENGSASWQRNEFGLNAEATATFFARLPDFLPRDGEDDQDPEMEEGLLLSAWVGFAVGLIASELEHATAEQATAAAKN